jgi:methionine-S-sulfoxide reductase
MSEGSMLRSSVLSLVASLVMAGCGASGCGGSAAASGGGGGGTVSSSSTPIVVPSPGVAGEGANGTQPAGEAPEGLAVATFAGGCFWCIEAAFEELPGVRDAISGYTGGPEQQPTYEQVANHATGHAEAVRVLYDPTVVTYQQLLHLFWRRVDATSTTGAFVDQGRQYRSTIYVSSPEERAAAERSLREIQASGVFDEPITVTIEDAGVFWVAETYHQNFHRTHPERYHSYHENSRRREYLREHWGPNAPY